MTSRAGKIATPLMVIGLFCAYLIAAVTPQAAQDSSGQDSVSLTTTTMSAAVTADSGSEDLPDLSRLEPLAVTPMVSHTPPARSVVSPVEVPVAPAQDAAAPEATPDGHYSMRWCVVTAYCPCARCCGRHSPGVTSTGTSAWKKGVAADPRAIPYHTRVFVDGYGYAVVDDTGGAMRRAYRNGRMPQIDLRMKYHWQARQWGRKIMQIRIYGEAE